MIAVITDITIIIFIVTLTKAIHVIMFLLGQPSGGIHLLGFVAVCIL